MLPPLGPLPGVMMHPAQNRVMMPAAILAQICSARIRTFLNY